MPIPEWTPKIPHLWNSPSFPLHCLLASSASSAPFVSPAIVLRFFFQNNNILSMFFHRSRSSCGEASSSAPGSPLPRLQQLRGLEEQLVSILGRRNVAVDESADIFTRLEELYLTALQGSPLGLEALEKCLRVLGNCDSPARVRFLYLCAHEMVLKGAAADELEPVLLEAFHSTLALAHKVDLGFKAALAFCQVSDHTAEVDKILSSLVVALQQELGYRPQKKVKAMPVAGSGGKDAHETTKAIYLGRVHVKPGSRVHAQGRVQRLELFKLLFEGFATGAWRVQSEAKRKYYQDCREELRGRLIREYPGREIEKRLAAIERRKTNALNELANVLNWSEEAHEEERQSSTQAASRGSHSKSTHKLNTRSKSQVANSAGFQSLKGSFLHEPQPPWATATASPSTLTPARKSSFKLQIRRNSKHKVPFKRAEDEVVEEKEKEKGEPRPEVTPLVFRDSNERVSIASSKGKEAKEGKEGKGIMLKFDRLQHSEVKKKKLRHTFNWEKEKLHKENQQQLQHVIDIQLLPQITEEPHPCPPSPQPPPPVNNSNTDLNSARRIDQLLKEGVEWISHLESEPSPNSKPLISNVALSECEPLHPAKPDQSFSDTHLVEERIVEEEAEEKDASYKIVIRPLEKPEVNLILAEEVACFLVRLGEAVVEREVRRGWAHRSREGRQNRIAPVKHCEVSIEIRQGNDSDCEHVEPAAQLQAIRQRQDRDEGEKEEIEELPDPLEGHSQENEEIEEEMAEAKDEVKEETVEQPQLNEEWVKSVAGDWLAEIEDGVTESLVQEAKEPSIPVIPEQPSSQESLPALPLSRLECSISAEHSSRSDSDHNPSSPSSPSISQAHLQVLAAHFEKTSEHLPDAASPGLLGFPEEREGSHFSCSRFAGSKIDTEKDSDGEWRSQMNFMNQIFRVDRVQEEVPLLQIPEQRREGRSLEECEELESESRNYRSRTQSEISNKSSNSRHLQGSARSASSRSPKKTQTQVCLSFTYTDNYEAAQTRKRFDHWLTPELTVADRQLTLTLSLPQRSPHRRTLTVPAFLAVNDDTLRAVSAKVEAFLGGYPEPREMGEEEWAVLGETVGKLELLPDETELPLLRVTQAEGEADELRCVANLKSLRIVLESTRLFLRVAPIVVLSLHELQTAIAALDPSQFCIRSGEILVRGAWTYAGQRNIKLRERSETAVSHLVFDVLERFNSDDRFDYCVREHAGQSLTFEGIEASRRARVLKNMDTIIGFCLKTVEGRVMLCGSHLKQFLTLL